MGKYLMNTALQNMINPVPTCSLKSWLCGVQPDENSVCSAFQELSSLYQSFEAKSHPTILFTSRMHFLPSTLEKL